MRAAPVHVLNDATQNATADLSGLYIVPPGHLLELEANDQVTLEVVFSLDGGTDFHPFVEARREQLRITAGELSRLAALIQAVRDKACQYSPTSSDARRNSKRTGRKPKDANLIASIQEAAKVFCKSLADPSGWTAEKIITSAQFIAVAFPGNKNAKTTNARKSHYANNFGIARRTVLDLIRAELRAAETKTPVENSNT